MGRGSTRATATVITASSSRRGGGPDDGEATLVDAVTDWFGSEPWQLVLEVELPGEPPFRHAQEYRISGRLGGLRHAATHWRPVPGLRLPVTVSEDRRDVDVDWRTFASEGGIRQAADAGAEQRTEQSTRARGKAMAGNHKLVARERRTALEYWPEHADQVITGVRDAGEFRRSVEALVIAGGLSEEEGDDLLRRAGIR